MESSIAGITTQKRNMAETGRVLMEPEIRGGGGSLKYIVRMVTSLASAPVAREISVFRFACTNASAGSKGC